MIAFIDCYKVLKISPAQIHPITVLCADWQFTYYFLLMLPHSTVHFLQTSAHFLQQSCAECFSHSVAHALQRSAQSLHNTSLNDEARASNLAHKAQMSAQSRQRDIHFI